MDDSHEYNQPAWLFQDTKQGLQLMIGRFHGRFHEIPYTLYRTCDPALSLRTERSVAPRVSPTAASCPT